MRAPVCGWGFPSIRWDNRSAVKVHDKGILPSSNATWPDQAKVGKGTCALPSHCDYFIPRLFSWPSWQPRLVNARSSHLHGYSKYPEDGDAVLLRKANRCVLAAERRRPTPLAPTPVTVE